jgi:hypothetical protein
MLTLTISNLGEGIAAARLLLQRFNNSSTFRAAEKSAAFLLTHGSGEIL